MNSKRKLLTLITATVAFSSLTVGTVLAQAKLTNQSKLTLNGIGTVRVGMTVKEATRAAGTKLVGDAPNNSCYYVNPQGEPKDISFMVTGGRISTIEVSKNSRISTFSGARIGNTEAQIKSLYPEQIKVTPHKYVQGGHYLTLVPKDRAYGNYRLIFETDGKRVTEFRSGKLPEVEFVEGCS
ncbi:MAG: hypothetical protein ACR2LR_22425 [Hassallia sp.]